MLNNSFTLALWRLPPSVLAHTTPAASMAASEPPAEPAAASAASQSPAPAAASASASTSRAASAPDAASEDAVSPPQTLQHFSHPSSGIQGAVASADSTTHGPRAPARSQHTPPVAPECDAVLMACVQLRFRAYSIDRSPDGRFVAVGKPQLLTCCAHAPASRSAEEHPRSDAADIPCFDATQTPVKVSFRHAALLLQMQADTLFASGRVLLTSYDTLQAAHASDCRRARKHGIPVRGGSEPRSWRGCRAHLLSRLAQ